jgi:hypothetical protein
MNNNDYILGLIGKENSNDQSNSINKMSNLNILDDAQQLLK